MSQFSTVVTLPPGGLEEIDCPTIESDEGSALWGEHTISSVSSSSLGVSDCVSVISSSSVSIEENFQTAVITVTEEQNFDDKVNSMPWVDCRHCNPLNPGFGTATVVSSACSSPMHSSPEDGSDAFSDDAMSVSSYSSELINLFSQQRLQEIPCKCPHSLDGFQLQGDSADSIFRSHTDVLTFSALPDELVCTITSYLDVSSLFQMRTASKRLKNLASSDEAGWMYHCQLLWAQKVHVCSEANFLLKNKKAMKAYQTACHDGRYRHEIIEDELCFDPRTEKGVIWHFRFKESAGPDWTSWDPWWDGRQGRKMVFLRDGSVKQLVPFDQDRPFTNGKRPKFELKDVFYDAAATGTLDNRRADLLAGITSSRLDMTWRFVSQPMDLPLRPRGAYIRLTVGERDVPTYVVHRSPTGNWGFVMESCWGVYSSFPLPLRQLQDATRSPRIPRTRMRLRRTGGIGRWGNVDGIESESEDEEEVSAVAAAAVDVSLMEDSALAVTNSWQWREALLYNYGAMTLPEGEGATAEFDRVWREALRPRHRNDDVQVIDQDMHSFFNRRQPI